MIRKLRQWITDSFGVPKTEANGTLVLIVAVLTFIIAPRLYFLTKETPTSNAKDQKLLKEWSKQLEMAFAEAEPEQKDQPERKKVSPRQLFRFDPNNASRPQLQSLGFSDLVAENIIRYRENGGSFAIRTDLKKIYGMDSVLLTELYPYIDLPESYSEHSPKKKEHKTEVLKLELNTATASDYQQIKGIGPILSGRIIKYRDRLGGFHSPVQLYEVYGLDSSVVSRLIERAAITEAIRKVNVNTDSAKQLYTHPYIDFKMANIIINYRQQHGSFDSVAQLKNIKIISDSLYQKIYPYLSINP